MKDISFSLNGFILCFLIQRSWYFLRTGRFEKLWWSLLAYAFLDIIEIRVWSTLDFSEFSKKISAKHRGDFPLKLCVFILSKTSLQGNVDLRPKGDYHIQRLKYKCFRKFVFLDPQYRIEQYLTSLFPRLTSRIQHILADIGQTLAATAVLTCKKIPVALMILGLVLDPITSTAYAKGDQWIEWKSHGNENKSKHELKAELEITPHKCISPCAATLAVDLKHSSDSGRISKYLFRPEKGVEIESLVPSLDYKYVFLRDKHKHGHHDHGKHVFKAEVELVLADGKIYKHELKDEIVVEGRANTPPSAQLILPETIKVNHTATFDARGSADLENSIKTFRFDFGNGVTREGTEPMVEYAYPSPGIFTVLLTVFDLQGLSATFSKTITVLANQLPQINFGLSPSAPYFAPATVSVDLRASTDPDGLIASGLIDWGDGTSTSALFGTHTYSAGVFLIQAQVLDDDGAAATQTQTVEIINNLAPVARIVTTPLAAKGSFRLDASSSSDPDGTIASATWNLGETTKNGLIIEHNFPSGSSLAALTVTDNRGRAASTSVNIFVPADEINGGGLAGVDSGDVGVSPSDIQITTSTITPPELIEGVFKPISAVVEVNDVNHPGGVVYPSGMIKLQFKYDPAILTSLNLLPNFMVFYQDTDLAWKRVNFIEVDPVNHLVYAYTNHLSFFVLTAKQDVLAPIIALEYFSSHYSRYSLHFSITDSQGVDYSRLLISMNGQVLSEQYVTVDPLLNTVIIDFDAGDSFVLHEMYNTITIKVPDQNSNLAVKGMAFKVEEMPSSPVRFSFTPGGGELTTTTPVVQVSMVSEMALNYESFEARLNNVVIPSSLISFNQTTKEATITFNQDFPLSITNFSILTVQISTTIGQQAVGMVGFDTVNRSVQVLVGANSSAANAGGHHTCAVLTNGGVRCFGDNSFGQLGYPGLANVGLSVAPESVGDVQIGGPAKKVVTGGKHTCVLLTSGDVRCFGDASFGKLGVGNTLGTQTKIGDDEYPSTIATVSLGGPAIDLVAGREHTCAAMQDRSIRCWGLGTSGQLGNGSFENIGDDELPSSIAAISLVTGPNFQIVAGAFHTCFKSDNEISCTGENSVGQLGLGDTVNRASFTPLEITPSTTSMMQLVSGAFHLCLGGNAEFSEFYCWGEGSYGKLGRGIENIGDDELPFQGENFDNNIRDLLSHVFSTAGAEGEVALGDNHTCLRGGEGAVGCFGRSDFGALGGIPGPEGYVLVNLGASAKKIFAGANHTCAVLSSNNLKCWGEGASGELGIPGITSIGVDNAPADFTSINLGGPVNLDVINPVVKSTLASFTVSPQYGSAPLTVHFDASSSYTNSGEIVRYVWDPGDYSDSAGGDVNEFETTLPAFDYTYPGPGLYFAHLRIQTDGMEQEQDQTVRLVNVSAASAPEMPRAIITADSDIGVAPFLVNFSGALSTSPSGNLVNYAWNFGTGESGTSTANPEISYVFNQAGTYVVTLKVTNSEGVESLESFLVIVTTPSNEIPVAKINCTKNDKTFTCDASGSFDLDGIVTEFVWNMGDGTILSGAQIVHTYAMTGEFDMTLSVLDQSGNTGVQIKRIHAGNLPPEIIAINCDNSAGGLTISCFLAVIEYEAPVTTVIMDWGDGVVEELPYSNQDAHGFPFEHQYDLEGAYHIMATVRDLVNLTATIETDVRVGGGTGSIGTLAAPEDFYFRCAPDPRLIGVNQSSECFSVTAPASMQVHAGLPSGEEFVGPSFTLNFTDVGETQLNLDFSFMNGSRVTFNIPITVQSQDAPMTAPLNIQRGDMSCHLNGRVASCNTISGSPFGNALTTGWTFFDGDRENDFSGPDADFTYDQTATNGRITGRASYNTASGIPVLETQEFGVSFTTDGGANFPPVAVINCAILAGNRVHCDPDTSYDPDGMIVEYQWEVPELGLLFNDETIAFDLPANIPPMGIQVLLAVVDNAGASAMAETFVGGNSSANIPPTAIISCEAIGLQVSCDAESSYDTDGMVTQYNWSIAEISDSSETATFQFALPMSGFVAHVELTVTDNLGATSSTVQTVSGADEGSGGGIGGDGSGPGNVAPVAILTCQESGVLNLNCDASYSNDPDGSIVFYTYALNGQTVVGGETLSWADIKVQSPGPNTITLNVYDNLGAKNTVELLYDVQSINPPPVIALSCFDLGDGEVSCNTSGSYDPNDMIVYFEWELGDGHFMLGNEIVHNYQISENYTIYVRAYDLLGAVSTATYAISIDIPVRAPIADLACHRIGQKGVHCVSQSTQVRDTIATLAWDMGDGTILFGEAIDHDYADVGVYPIILTATNTHGLTAQATTSVNIAEQQLFASFNCQMQGLNMICDASASQAGGIDQIIKYRWRLSDGSVFEELLPAFDYKFYTGGDYQINLEVITLGSQVGRATQNVYATGPFPIVQFWCKATYDRLSCDARDTHDTDSLSLTYEWTINGRNLEQSSSLSKFDDYNILGDTLLNQDIIVNLKVRDHQGQTAQKSQTIRFIGGDPRIPIAHFICQKLVDLSYKCNAQTSYDTDGDIVSYQWNTSIGQQASGREVIFDFPNHGSFLLQLTVADDDGKQGQVVKEIITIGPADIQPIAYCVADSVKGTNTGVTCDATRTVNNSGNPLEYEWHMGDAIILTGETVHHNYALPASASESYLIGLTATSDGNRYTTSILFTNTTTDEGVDPSPGILNPNLAPDTAFYPVESVLTWQLQGANFHPVAEELKVNITINGVEVPSSNILIDSMAQQLTLQSGLLDGLNEIEISAFDDQGRLITGFFRYVAGSHSIQLTSSDEQLSAVASANIKMFLLSDHDIVATGTSDLAGNLTILNVPSKPMAVIAQMGNELHGIDFYKFEADTNAQITLRAFLPPSSIANNDFSQGTDGWESIGASTSIQDHISLLTGNIVPDEKNLAASSDGSGFFLIRRAVTMAEGYQSTGIRSQFFGNNIYDTYALAIRNKMTGEISFALDNFDDGVTDPLTPIVGSSPWLSVNLPVSPSDHVEAWIMMKAAPLLLVTSNSPWRFTAPLIPIAYAQSAGGINSKTRKLNDALELEIKNVELYKRRANDALAFPKDKKQDIWTLSIGGSPWFVFQTLNGIRKRQSSGIIPVKGKTFVQVSFRASIKKLCGGGGGGLGGGGSNSEDCAPAPTSSNYKYHLILNGNPEYKSEIEIERVSGDTIYGVAYLDHYPDYFLNTKITAKVVAEFDDGWQDEPLEVGSAPFYKKAKDAVKEGTDTAKMTPLMNYNYYAIGGYEGNKKEYLSEKYFASSLDDSDGYSAESEEGDSGWVDVRLFASFHRMITENNMKTNDFSLMHGGDATLAGHKQGHTRGQEVDVIFKDVPMNQMASGLESGKQLVALLNQHRTISQTLNSTAGSYKEHYQDALNHRLPENYATKIRTVLLDYEIGNDLHKVLSQNCTLLGQMANDVIKNNTNLHPEHAHIALQPESGQKFKPAFITPKFKVSKNGNTYSIQISDEQTRIFADVVKDDNARIHYYRMGDGRRIDLAMNQRYFIKVVQFGPPCGQLEFELTPNPYMACENAEVGSFDKNNNFIAEDATVNSSRSNAAFCDDEPVDELSSIYDSVINAGVTNSTIMNSTIDNPVSDVNIQGSVIKSSIDGYYSLEGHYPCVAISNSEIIGTVFKAHGCGSISSSILHGGSYDLGKPDRYFYINSSILKSANVVGEIAIANTEVDGGTIENSSINITRPEIVATRDLASLTKEIIFIETWFKISSSASIIDSSISGKIEQFDGTLLNASITNGVYAESTNISHAQVNQPDGSIKEISGSITGGTFKAEEVLDANGKIVRTITISDAYLSADSQVKGTASIHNGPILEAGSVIVDSNINGPDTILTGATVHLSNINRETIIKNGTVIFESNLTQTIVGPDIEISGTNASNNSSLQGNVQGILQVTANNRPSIVVNFSEISGTVSNSDLELQSLFIGSFVDVGATVTGPSYFNSSIITGGTIGSSGIFSSTISGGVIVDTAISDSQISGGTILNSTIGGMNIGSAMISNSTISGGTPRKALGYSAVVNKYCYDYNNNGIIAPFWNPFPGEYIEECWPL